MVLALSAGGRPEAVTRLSTTLAGVAERVEADGGTLDLQIGLERARGAHDPPGAGRRTGRRRGRACRRR
jgi:hypothetical protein